PFGPIIGRTGQIIIDLWPIKITFEIRALVFVVETQGMAKFMQDHGLPIYRKPLIKTGEVQGNFPGAHDFRIGAIGTHKGPISFLVESYPDMAGIRRGPAAIGLGLWVMAEIKFDV